MTDPVNPPLETAVAPNINEDAAVEAVEIRPPSLLRRPLRSLPLPLKLLLLCLCGGVLAYAAIQGRAAIRVLVSADAAHQGPAGYLRTATNNFDVSNASIPKGEIMRGGPPRDGIPAILKPAFVAAKDADHVSDDDLVVGFAANGEARAYPLRILVWHEIANDTVAGQPIAITYCPLCGTCMVFDRRYKNRELTFGVSGLLYQSDVLMYDHQTESLWSQLKTEAVSGPMVGERLKWLPSEQMTWAAWREEHPETKVLSTNTGFSRNYKRMPYKNYETSPGLMFPVPFQRDELEKKDWVVGVLIDGQAKAFPVAKLEGLGENAVEDVVGGQAIKITYNAAQRRAQIRLRDSGEAVPHVTSYWFAWQAFYPETALF